MVQDVLVLLVYTITFPNFLLIAVLFYNVNRKDAMMHKPILDDRKKEFRGLTIHKMV